VGCFSSDCHSKASKRFFLKEQILVHSFDGMKKYHAGGALLFDVVSTVCINTTVRFYSRPYKIEASPRRTRTEDSPQRTPTAVKREEGVSPPRDSSYKACHPSLPVICGVNNINTFSFKSHSKI